MFQFFLTLVLLSYMLGCYGIVQLGAAWSQDFSSFQTDLIKHSRYCTKTPWQKNKPLSPSPLAFRCQVGVRTGFPGSASLVFFASSRLLFNSYGPQQIPFRKPLICIPIDSFSPRKLLGLTFFKLACLACSERPWKVTCRNVIPSWRAVLQQVLEGTREQRARGAEGLGMGCRDVKRLFG